MPTGGGSIRIQGDIRNVAKLHGTPLPSGIVARIEVKASRAGISSKWVEIEQVSESQYKHILKTYDRFLHSGGQISDAVAKAFQFAVKLCPATNPSDLWHHVIYRHLIDGGKTDQQWKRISGFALERALARIYQLRLEPYGVRMRIIPAAEAATLLRILGLAGAVRVSKIDLFLEGSTGSSWRVFGAAHAKSSIAERIQDDVPASQAFMRKGLLSVALTMDMKSYPPPHGEGINYGELGGRSVDVEKFRMKRAYVEEDGQFDAMFSFNLRTPSSPKKTPSGKRIHTLSLAEEQPDAFVEFVSANWRARSRRSRAR